LPAGQVVIDPQLGSTCFTQEFKGHDVLPVTWDPCWHAFGCIISTPALRMILGADAQIARQGVCRVP
jgi:hypothetical protein